MLLIDLSGQPKTLTQTPETTKPPGFKKTKQN